MSTRSIWSGLLVHATIAVGMDVLALNQRGELPSGFPPVFGVLGAVWFVAAGLALRDLPRLLGWYLVRTAAGAVRPTGDHS